MRWTYKSLIAIYLLLVTQCIAQPIFHVASRADAFQLSKRTRSIPPRRSTQHRDTPGYKSARPAKTPANRRPPKRSRPKLKPSDIRTWQVKSDNYRSQTVQDKYGGDKAKALGLEADHILEVQTVTHYLNTHRNNVKISATCLEKIMTALNAKTNLDFLNKKENGGKARVVADLIHKYPHPNPFDLITANYIKSHRTAITNTANAIDALFGPSGDCPEIPTPTDGGVAKEAKHMIDHAITSSNAHLPSP